MRKNKEIKPVDPQRASAAKGTDNDVEAQANRRTMGARWGRKMARKTSGWRYK